jgi:trehalose/maltose hydrolase-like predicted phosphorylase
LTTDTWTIEEPQFDLDRLQYYEALLAIGSGPLQQRAALEEGLLDDPQDMDELPADPLALRAAERRRKSQVGTFLPGLTGHHPTLGTEMVNLPAIHGLLIYSAGERLDMESPRVRDYRRALDMRTGRLVRTCTWQTAAGSVLRLRFERLISAARRHVMALRFGVEHVDGPPAELRFLAPLDAEVQTNGFDHFQLIEITGEHEPITLLARTHEGIDVAAAALMTSAIGLPWSVDEQHRWVALSTGTTIDPGQALVFDKFAALTSSLHAVHAPLDAARRLTWDAAADGFERVAAESDAVWQERWAQADIEIDGDDASQRAARIAMYHLLRAVVEDDPRAPLDSHVATDATRGGWCRWETDIHALPALLYTRPEVGRTLARFRVASLDGARRNAARLGYAGARYAWASGPDGVEPGQIWQHTDHAVHVTADVAHGLFHVHLAYPEDRRLLRDVTEVLIETARYWCERVTYNEADESYELLMTTGPDRYTPFSRNNAYTNRQVALALGLANFAWEKLQRLDADAADALGAALHLEEGELTRFTDVAARLRMPYDTERGLVLQSDDFLERAAFDFERHWPNRSRPLRLVVHPERLFRSQVLRQADVVQLMALCPHEFYPQQMRTAFAYYTPLTAHDAGCSRPLHALVAVWIDDMAAAERFWNESVAQLLSLPVNPGHVETGELGALWQALVLGFGGFRTRMQSDELHVNPRLLPAWRRLRYRVVWEQQPLDVTVTEEAVTIANGGSRAVPAIVCRNPVTIEPGETRRVVR